MERSEHEKSLRLVQDAKVKIEKQLLSTNKDQLQAALLNEIKDDELFKELVATYKQDYDYMDFLTLYEIYKNKKLCENCQGLNFCKQSSKGLALDYDGQSIIYKPCHYKEGQENIKSHLKNIVYSTADFDSELPDLLDVDVSNNDKIQVIKFIRDNESNQGFYLYGPPGVGKTFLLLATMKYYLNLGYKCAFVRMNDLYFTLSKIVKSYDSDDQQIFSNILLKLSKVDILFIDDIGVEQINTDIRDLFLLPLLNNRMEHKRLTFFTSNVAITDLHKRYSINTYGQSDNQTVGQYAEERIKALAKPLRVSGTQSQRHDIPMM